MLVISRREKEAIRIGEATVYVLKTTSNRVKIGIDAPDEVKVLRTELNPLVDGDPPASSATTDLA